MFLSKGFLPWHTSRSFSFEGSAIGPAGPDDILVANTCIRHKTREVWPSGTIIKGGYVIERCLGSGGFGTVDLARHRYLETMNVIKRLHDQYASDVEFARKFLKEPRVSNRAPLSAHPQYKTTKR